MKKQNGLFWRVSVFLMMAVFVLAGCKDPLSETDPTVVFSGVSADGSSTQTTTQLTLFFDSAIEGLTADNITLTGVDGVAKGTLSGSGPSYTLGISGFTAGGTLTVTVAKAGFVISGAAKSTTIYYCPAPSVPGGVTATAQSSSSINVTWDAVSGATYYNVYYEIGGTSTKNLASENITGTSYIHTGLTANTTYYYYIKAVNSAGESDYSSSASATTSSSGGTTAPSAPTGVTATPQSSSSINVTWNAVSGATSYKVYYSNYMSPTTLAAENITGTSYTHTGLIGGITYYYSVIAVNSAGESDYSSSTNTTIPYSGPTGVTATAQSSSSIKVTWNAVSDAEFYYVSYAIGNSSSDKEHIDSHITGTSYTHTGLTANTTYYYFIRAYNGHSASAFSLSSSASATTQSGGGGGGTPTTQKLAAPTGLSAYWGGNFVQISFNEVSLAASYELYRSTSATGTYTKIPATGGTSGSKYILTDSSPRTGTSYYKVKALPSSYTPNLTASDLSSYISVSSSSGGTTVPSAPTGVTATALSASSINVTWNAVSGATSYKVYYAVNAYGNYTLDGTVSTTTFTSTGWVAGNTGYFKVIAVNSAGESAYSSYAYATTSSSSGGTSAPKAPTFAVRQDSDSSAVMAFLMYPLSDKSTVDDYTYIYYVDGRAQFAYTNAPVQQSDGYGTTGLTTSTDSIYSVVIVDQTIYNLPGTYRIKVEIRNGSQSIMTAERSVTIYDW